jgi:hypothetical protein
VFQQIVNFHKCGKLNEPHVGKHCPIGPHECVMLVGLTPITYCLSAVANHIPASYVNYLGRNLHGHSYMSHTRMHTCALELAPSSRVLFEKQMVAQLPSKLPVSYGTRTYITVFKAARQWNLSFARYIQSTPTSLHLLFGLKLSLHAYEMRGSHSSKDVDVGLRSNAVCICR